MQTPIVTMDVLIMFSYISSIMLIFMTFIVTIPTCTLNRFISDRHKLRHGRVILPSPFSQDGNPVNIVLNLTHLREILHKVLKKIIFKETILNGAFYGTFVR